MYTLRNVQARLLIGFAVLITITLFRSLRVMAGCGKGASKDGKGSHKGGRKSSEKGFLGNLPPQPRTASSVLIETSYGTTAKPKPKPPVLHEAWSEAIPKQHASVCEVVPDLMNREMEPAQVLLHKAPPMLRVPVPRFNGSGHRVWEFSENGGWKAMDPKLVLFLNAESCRGSKSCEWHLEGGKKYHFDLEELKQRRMEFFDEEWHTVNIRDVRQISILKLAASLQQV